MTPRRVVVRADRRRGMGHQVAPLRGRARSRGGSCRGTARRGSSGCRSVPSGSVSSSRAPVLSVMRDQVRSLISRCRSRGNRFGAGREVVLDHPREALVAVLDLGDGAALAVDEQVVAARACQVLDPGRALPSGEAPRPTAGGASRPGSRRGRRIRGRPRPGRRRRRPGRPSRGAPVATAWVSSGSVWLSTPMRTRSPGCVAP